ncbi:MAG TPA: SpoIIE family protein phosphatase [Thermoanaerobaculia bacterium]|nr:SpoIIE family protein phosphatase [Thermoanaerobaculia bacterium]
MRIRTQLIVAAFVLAVIPLAAIVGYSYTSSRKALEKAYRSEAERLTKQMDRRLAAIRADLDQRLTVVSALPIPDRDSTDVGSIATVLGEAASFVDALEFQPVRAPAPPAAASESRESAPSPQTAQNTPRTAQSPSEKTAATSVEETAAAQPVPAAPAAPQIAVLAPPEAPPAPRHPFVIELPSADLQPYVMSEEQRELIAEISTLGSRLANRELSAEEREDLQKEMHDAQEQLRRVVTADRKRLQESLREAQRIQRERRAAIDAARQAQREGRVIVVQTPQVAPVAGVAPVSGISPSPGVSPSTSVAAPASVATPAPMTSASTAAPKREQPAASAPVRRRTENDEARSAATEKRASLILGRNFETPVRSEGEIVGQLRARISPEQVLRRVLGSSSDETGELAFAIDREGNVYTRNPKERAQLDALGIPARVRRGESGKGIDGWIVSTSTDPQSGLRIGVARPVGENLLELRRAAARNFGLGLGMIAFALFGMIPLSNHLTRDVKRVTEGAERIAHGDLMTRLPIKTKNEIGQLARAFNRMAEDLSIHQQKLLEQERARKEQEMQQRLLAVEYERKSVELEDARRFQLSMLPKEVPRHPRYEIAVFTRTATEVGGDYYDFHVDGDALSVTIGDATGHGAKAGTMVTVIKTLFSAYSSTIAPSAFLSDAAEKIKRMDLGRMAMALAVARLEVDAVTLASAGMPPALLRRASGDAVEEVGLAATPLGTLGVEYQQIRVPLSAGDTLLFLSDGFPELLDETGQQLGYGGAMDAFGIAARESSADAVIASLSEHVRRWRGDSAPNDDVTFVVVRVRGNQ